jgi:hypothetical protein
MRFTLEQTKEILYEDGIYTENGDPVFTVVSEEIVGTDQDKNHIDKEVVVKEHSTGKFYKAVIGESPWYKQMEHNSTKEWIEVRPYTVTITKYR